MKRVNIIAWHNGGGLSRDIEILANALRDSEFTVTLNGLPLAQAPVRRQRIVHRAANLLGAALHHRQLTAAPYAINIFLEDINPLYYRYARANVFIPNPEWFKRHQRAFLGGIDTVLCKTRSAQATFDALGARTRWISFTSEDRLDALANRAGPPEALHVAGRSWQKGTQALVDAWRRHPEWPRLTIVQNARTYSQMPVKPVDAPNIRHILQRLDDAALKALQNSIAIHLCPSEAEGFGHCIAEAMSCRAVTLTTDAPPMNELVTPERGVLVKYHRMRAQRAGANYYVDPADLERQIAALLQMDEATKQRLGQQARAWFDANDRAFRTQLVDALAAVSAARAPV